MFQKVPRGNVRAILANSGWLLADRVIRMTLGVFVGAWVARYLGPASFGELAYAIAYIALFQTVATLGLDGVVVRDISRNVDSAGEVLGTAFVLRAVAGSTTWLIGVGALAWFKGVTNPYVILSAILGANLVFQAADAIDLWFQSQVQSRRTVIAKLLACFASNLIKVLLIYFKAPLPAFAGVLAFEVAAGALALSIVYGRAPAPGAWRFHRPEAFRLLTESWPFIVAGAVNMVQARIEFVMIESFLGASALGQYAAASRFIEIFDLIFVALGTSIFPKVSKGGPETSDTTFQRVYFLAVLTYIAIVPVLFCVWLSLGVIYGSQYDVARRIFPLMAVRPLLAYIGIAKSMIIRVSFPPRYALFCSAIGACLAAGGAYFLLPTLGLTGAIVASLASYLVSNVLIDALFFRKNFSNILLCWKQWRYFTGLIRVA